MLSRYKIFSNPKIEIGRGKASLGQRNISKFVYLKAVLILNPVCIDDHLVYLMVFKKYHPRVQSNFLDYQLKIALEYFLFQCIPQQFSVLKKIANTHKFCNWITTEKTFLPIKGLNNNYAANLGWNLCKYLCLCKMFTGDMVFS